MANERFGAAAFALVLGLTGGALAQGPQAAGRPVYDARTAETVTGTVTTVERVPSPKGKGAGVHLLLKTSTETLPVHLGPSWYVDAQGVKIGEGDRLDVKGSRVVLAGKPTLIAAEVTKGDTVLRLRDPNGVPLWSRGGRR